MQFNSKISYMMFLHSYHLAGEISTVRTLALTHLIPPPLVAPSARILTHLTPPPPPLVAPSTCTLIHLIPPPLVAPSACILTHLIPPP